MYRIRERAKRKGGCAGCRGLGKGQGGEVEEDVLGVEDSGKGKKERRVC